MSPEIPAPIYLVKVGMSMTEGAIDEWYVADGAHVAAGDLLYRLETEKVHLDVDAEVSGAVEHAVGEGITLPLRGMRRTIANSMAMSTWIWRSPSTMAQFANLFVEANSSSRSGDRSHTRDVARGAPLRTASSHRA